ncbi:MAG: hypothetical protein Q4A54_00350 [Parabacteroides sp.]|nr:hypothetical protein [Parabacteroides sp.]
MKLKDRKAIVLELDVENDKFHFPTTISDALVDANNELHNLDEQLNESLETIKLLTPECDKYDYILSACSGALCGIIDIFLVGKPGESPLGNITDNWFADRTLDFAKICGYKSENESLSSAIKFLEKKFKVPYDQSVGGGIFKELINLTPSNHHFKSLAHNPTILGLFFSILNQFTNTSSFVSNGELITLTNSDNKFELRGNNIPSKLFCGIVNWIGHLISDMSGSSSSKGRGMGVPSPLLAWSNDVIAIKRKLNIPASEFDKSTNDLALKLFEKGYDARFQTTQAIPVFINEMVVRLLYSIRRLIRYFSATPKEERSFSLLWKSCEPFSNATVKRMLTVAHGTFCLIDISDATIKGFATGGGTFNVVEFFMRFNIIGVGRFTISLYGEIKRGTQKAKVNYEALFISRNKVIVEDYINGLRTLSHIYDDELLLRFVDDFQESDLYINGFNKSIEFARLRDVPDSAIMESKADIDSYFRGGK